MMLNLGLEVLQEWGMWQKGLFISLSVYWPFKQLSDPGGKTTDSKGAFATIAGKPFGEALLWLLAVGLIGYAAWKIIQAFKDPDNKGRVRK